MRVCPFCLRFIFQKLAENMHTHVPRRSLTVKSHIWQSPVALLRSEGASTSPCALWQCPASLDLAYSAHHNFAER